MKKAIIFGANGYLGRNITFYLFNKGYSLNIFDLHNSSIDSYSFYEQLDILDKENLKLIDFNVDYVFILSGLNGTASGFDKYEDFIKVNEIGTLNILNQVKESNSKARIIFPSTRLIYKENNHHALSEESEKKFNTIYALNKNFCENVLQIYSDVFNIKYNTFRISVPYGNLIGNQYNYGTISFFLKKALNGENITIYGKGKSRRTFTHIYDIINIIEQVISIECTENQIYNIGGESLTLKEVATILARQFNVGVDYIDWPVIEKKIEVGDSVFNSEKIDKLLNYKYAYHFKDWVACCNHPQT